MRSIAEYAKTPEVIGEHIGHNINNLTFGDSPDALRHMVKIIDHIVKEVATHIAAAVPLTVWPLR